jgi:peptide/nickel transport system permease protein
MTAVEAPVASRTGLAKALTRRYGAALRSPRGRIGLGLVVAMAALAVAAPLLFPQGYDEQTRDALAGASLGRPFGTDELGRDIFVRSIYGLRTDLSLIVVAVPLAAIVGTLLGLAGAVSPMAGNFFQRVFDLIMGFPSLILGIAVAIVLRPGWAALVIALGIYAMPAFGRLARATLVAQQHRDYVQAARMLGVNSRQIMVRHILPHCIDTMITQMVVAVVASIFLEASLSIVGLGIQPPAPSLGSLLNVGSRFAEQQQSYVVGPALLLFLLVLGFSLLADSLTSKGVR